MEQTNKLLAAEKTIQKQIKRIRNLENVLDALKDELREARERATVAEIAAQRRAEAEGPSSSRDERILSALVSLAQTLSAISAREQRRPARG